MDPLRENPLKTWPSRLLRRHCSHWRHKTSILHRFMDSRPQTRPKVTARWRSENDEQRLTPPSARLYCAPSHLKRVFRDFSFIDGVQKRAILGSSPEAFVALGHYLKIRIGNLCRDSRRCAFGAIR